MSSTLVLARKYRPRNFEELVGQPHVVQALSNALTLGRLHHAYLFTGTRGIGKTTVSRILAKSLNCVGPDGQGGITAHPCGTCHVCMDIDAGRFIDYVELDAASNRGVDEVSQLLEQAVYKPVEGRYKVFMIDEVHMLSTTAFNAMLKTLEEPPDYLKFILATTDPQKIPVTVLSRCLQFNLRPVNPQDVQEHLQKILAAEGIEAQPGALRLLARFARGSMRDGLSLTDQAIAYGAGRLNEDVVRQMLGTVDRSYVFTLLDALAAQDGPGLLAGVDGLRAQGVAGLATLEEMAQVLHQIAVAQMVPAAAVSDDADQAGMAQLAQRLPADEVQLFYSISLQGRSELMHAPDEYSGVTMVLLRMLAFRQRFAQEPHASPELEPSKTAPAGRVTTVSQALAPPPAQLSETGPTPGASPQAAPTDDAQTQWACLIAPLIEAGAINALVRELAVQAQCVNVQPADAKTIGPGVAASVQLLVERESLRSPSHCQRLSLALKDHYHADFQLDVQAGTVRDSIAIRETIAQQKMQLAAEALIHNDVQVTALMQQFKSARIVPGSIKPIVEG